MRAAEFKRSVRTRAAALPRWALDAAAESFAGVRRLTAADVAACIQLAERFALSHADAAQLPRPLGLTVTTEQVLDAVRPDVEGLRRELFGAPSPPFESLAAAAEWIRKEAGRQRRPGRRAAARAEQLMHSARSAMAEAAQLLGQWAEPIGPRSLTVPYVTDFTAAVQVARAVRGTRLGRLAETVDALASSTRFAAAAVSAYILVGIPPLLPVATVTSHTRSTRGLGAVRWATIELNSAAIAPRQFLALYDHVRQTLGVTAWAKPLTAKHQRLLDAVKQLGGEPAPGAGRAAFWERVRAALNRQGERYTTWRGPEMRYRRLMKRLGGPS
jgi:hypothetical protein